MKYVALLRGINVGGNNKVEMKKLKTVFEDLGFQKVLTYINSGNVIFETGSKDVKKIVVNIEKAIADNFKLDIRVVVRDGKNIKKICEAVPSEWVNDKDQKTDVLFLWEEYASKKSLELIKTNSEVDILLYVDKAIIWHVNKKDYNQSGMDKFIGTEVYKNMTARNINTVRRLAELMSE